MIDGRRGSRGTTDADRIAAGRTPDAGDPARRGAGASGLPIVPATTTIDAAAAVVAVAAADRLGSNHPVDVYVQRLRTAVSRQTTERKLDMVARVLDELWPGSVQLDHLRGERFGVPWLALTPVACERLRNALADRWAPATANAALAAIRGVLRAAWLAGAFDADGRDRLFEGLRAVHGDRVYVKRSTAPSPATGEDVAGATAVSPARASSPTLSPALLEAWMDDEAPGEVGRHLEPAEIERLWSCAADDPKAARGARNLAVLALLYGCGLRAGEAVALTLADVETAEEPSVRVFGKGRKRRTVPIPPRRRRRSNAGSWSAATPRAPCSCRCSRTTRCWSRGREAGPPASLHKR